jgi:hypothetical protein
MLPIRRDSIVTDLTGRTDPCQVRRIADVELNADITGLQAWLPPCVDRTRGPG